MEVDADTLARLLAAADRVAIIENLGRYHQAIDAKNWAGLNGIFTDDAQCEFVIHSNEIGFPTGGNLEGIANIKKWLSDGLTSRPTTNPHHFMMNHVCEVDGDTAQSRSFLSTRLGAVGIYEVEHVRVGGSWRIHRLRLEEDQNPQP